MTRSQRQYIPSARRDPPVVLLENCLEAERRHDVLKWAPTAMPDLVARGLITLPAGKTVDDLRAAAATPAPTPTERRWSRKNGCREVATKILAHLRAGTIANIGQAAPLLRIAPTTAYKAWNRWGPFNWAEPTAVIRDTPRDL